MAAVKKISPIKKSFPPGYVTLETSLAQHGYYRSPGANKTILPYKEANGRYRTGLDIDAPYLQTYPKEQRDAEIARIKADKKRLEEATGFDLSPTSKYYNYAAPLPEEDKVTPVKLGNGDAYFPIDNGVAEITWNWIRVHPNIAPSLQAIQNGDVHPSMVQYYVADDGVENQITFSKKQRLNKAIGQLEALSPSKRRQIGRLMGLPATEDTKEEVIYNLIDSALKEGEFTTGEHRGANAVSLFTDLLEMEEQRAHVKDVVAQAIATSIYRKKGNGKLFEGESEVAASVEEQVNFLLKDKNQEDLLALERKLKINKIQAT